MDKPILKLTRSQEEYIPRVFWESVVTKPDEQLAIHRPVQDDTTDQVDGVSPRLANSVEPVLPYEPYAEPIGPSLEPPGGTATVTARRYKGSPRPAWMDPRDYAALPEYVRTVLADQYREKYEKSMPTYVPPRAALPAGGAVFLITSMMQMP